MLKVAGVMRCTLVKWSIRLVLALFVTLCALIGYRAAGFWHQCRTVAELGTVEASWRITGPKWMLPSGQNSPLFEPYIWNWYSCLVERVDFLLLRDLTDADLERDRQELDSFSPPIRLVIMSDKITDAGLETIASLKNVSGLDLCLQNARITDLGLARLATMENLEHLSIDCGALTNQSVLEISRFPRLERIELIEIPITVRALQALGNMKTLKYLDIRSARFSDEDEVREEVRIRGDARPDLRILSHW